MYDYVEIVSVMSCLISTGIKLFFKKCSDVLIRVKPFAIVYVFPCLVRGLSF